MQTYLNKGIKEVISEYPQVGEILQEFGVGCVTCTVGTCLLKDIIGVHNLSKDQENAVMSKIEKIIYPEREVTIPDNQVQNSKLEKKEIKYSPPIKKLVDEHTRIKKLLGFIPDICKSIDLSEEIDKKLVLDCVDFIRNYADKFHHAKEEDILFKYTDENQDIIKVMYEDHKTGRSYVKTIISALNEEDRNTICKCFMNYRELLTEHIKKEDEILYPWIDKNLTTRDVGNLSEQFNLVDEKLGYDVEQRFDEFLNHLNEIYK